ncbi:bifunctional diguanylate cyclase/phosphodiesterase [Tepidiforma sp.]|uniref:bifunctional diguanylate cyclase/phosphodiesterase n=1 Tax=Tepidiforma sp. TaxID=2682230 RepID=UPI002ADE5CC1|nr:bifunctional diguanylate cyclase/phosphodiesterase [Tepidiforma sp.]
MTTPIASLVTAASARRTVQHALETGAVRSLCQPIVSLSTGETFGFEALSRPECPAPLDNPQHFLAAAAAANLLAQVDQAWRVAAVTRFGPLLAADQALFLNCTPRAFETGYLRPGPFQAFVRRHGLHPERVVLEITEEHAIEDFDHMRRLLSAFRACGFLIAIDDAGAGPSSLQSIVELRPDFIKLDRWLARDIEFDRGRRSMVEAIASVAAEVGARLIAEGIESAGQLAAFVELGAHFGQGYFLGRPEALPLPAVPEARNEIRLANRRRRELPLAARVGDLVTITPTVPADTPGSTVFELFHTNLHLQAVVVVEQDRPRVLGIITRGRIYERMTGQFGLPLNGRRPARDLCAPATLVDAALAPRVAARVALERPGAAQEDPLVVLDGGAPAGIVRLPELLQAVLAEEVAEARNLNPLTGLPGNQRIRQQVEQLRANPGQWLILYADLDNFKHFNDRHGFAHGDTAILQLARILTDAAARCVREPFIGHVGGDDFVILLHAGDLPTFRLACQRALAEPHWFDPARKLQGVVLTASIGGCPLAALSGLAYEDLAETLARAKRIVKSSGGNSFRIFEDLSPESIGNALGEEQAA